MLSLLLFKQNSFVLSKASYLVEKLTPLAYPFKRLLNFTNKKLFMLKHKSVFSQHVHVPKTKQQISLTDVPI